MREYSKVLLEKYFDKYKFVGSDIESFNNFLSEELQRIVNDNKEIIPTIIPQNIEEFKIKLDKIWVEKPKITEADGSKRNIFPMEARLRKMSYSAPVFMEISAHINNVQRESFATQVGSIPIMLKSEFCHLHGLSREELIRQGEDPEDEGGYFIIKGTEKVLISVEDLAPNKMFVQEDRNGTSRFVGTLFSESPAFNVLHTLEKPRGKGGIFLLSFSRAKRVPVICLIKALGMTKDQEIMKTVTGGEPNDELLINLYKFVEIKKEDEAMDYIAKIAGITQAKEIRLERVQDILDNFLLPHLGTKPEDRLTKAVNICKMLRRYVDVSQGRIPTDDKDHYMNKRVKLAGDLLADLFRVNLRILIRDLLYNFQRIVKRGKFPSIKVIIREKLLTSRIHSSMATGNWVGERKGISQRIPRLNYLETLSYLQKVVSPLSSSQENFAARELHPTHLGRLCPSETPEGTNIGLRKNLSLLAQVSLNSNEEEVHKALRNIGLKEIETGGAANE